MCYLGDVCSFKVRILHIPQETMVSVVNNGRKCSVYYMKEGKAAEYENVSDSKNQISVSGIFSELVVDMTI